MANSSFERARRPAPSDRVVDVELARTPPPGEWIHDAACVGQTELFFVHPGENAQPARDICTECPVLAQCRAYAIAAGWKLEGIWGGLTETERKKLRRRPKDVA